MVSFLFEQRSSQKRAEPFWACNSRSVGRANGEKQQGAAIVRRQDRFDIARAKIRAIGLPAAYEVGGCIRDELSGKPSKDMDIAVCGLTFDELKDALSKHGRVEVLEVAGQLVGVRLFNEWAGKEGIEFALARTEVSTGVGNKAFAIAPDPSLTIEQDLERRDFTVNAIARNIYTGELIDPFGGSEDIRLGRLRTVSPTSFRDDPVRILRGLVRVAKDGLVPDEQTIEEMRRYKDDLAVETQERIFAEMEKLLSGRHAADALKLARDIGLLQAPYVLPEFAATVGFDQESKYHSLSCDEHILLAVQRACEFNAPLEVRWAALLHDTGKPLMAWRGKDGHLHFYPNPGDREKTRQFREHIAAEAAELRAQGKKKEASQLEAEAAKQIIDVDGTTRDGRSHEAIGAELAVQALRRLKAPVELIDRVSLLVEEHMYHDDDQLTELSARRFLHRLVKKGGGGIDGRAFANDLMLLRRCDRAAKHSEALTAGWDKSLAEFEQLVEAAKDTPLRPKELPVSGFDVMSFGFKGPEVGDVLDKLLAATIDNPTLPRETMLLEVSRRAIREKKLGVGGHDLQELGFDGPALGRVIERLAAAAADDPDLRGREQLLQAASELR